MNSLLNPEFHPYPTRQWWRGPLLGANRCGRHPKNPGLGRSSVANAIDRIGKKDKKICSQSSCSSTLIGELKWPGSCLGGLAKSYSFSGRTLKTPPKRSRSRIPTRKRRKWSSSPETMENTVSIANSLETHISPCPLANDTNKLAAAENASGGSFVNHAAIAWATERRAWVGDQTRKLCQPPREPIISWCTTYDDLLSTNNPFPQPIPLSEMVDFLVDIWHEEGLYD